MKVAVVGAGLAGLMAGRSLIEAGHEVVLFDKGRSPGGRMATRRIGGARLDHGAQFFTVRTDQLQQHVDGWIADGLVYEWCRGFSTVGDGFPRYAVHGGMNALAKHLAAGLEVRCPSLVFSLHRRTGAHPWEVKLDDGTVSSHDALVVTCPLPQTFSLLMTAQVAMPEVLWRTDYDRTLSLLLVLDRDSGVPMPGGVQGVEPFTFIGDNRQKGISDVPAITVHADPAWSDAHWADEHAIASAALLAEVQPYLGEASVVASQLKRWRFATPRSIWPDAHWSPESMTNLAVAGDAFAGPRVEGAALSGLSAAAALSA
jgi:predicted NAD/FAD-dependent oxidoreductase